MTSELKQRIKDNLALELLRRDLALSKRVRRIHAKKVTELKARLKKLS